MARATYGNTWWGEQWLKALTHIDYDNRLPRGRSYANKGAVKNLKLTDGTLKAKVQGSRPAPYQVTIQVPPVSQKQAKQLLDALLADPLVIAQLLNRALSPSVMDHASELGIPIFPTRWQDLGMKCSCPDWAVPCKHLAAAIYLLSREIDSNPFLIFTLRGIDLILELQQQGVHIQREATIQPPRFSALLEPQPGTLPTSQEDVAAFDTLDYASLPDLASPLLALLPPNPAFFAHGDLREKWQKALSRTAKRARKVLDCGVNAETDRLLGTTHRPHITLSQEGYGVISGVDRIHTLEQLDVALRQLPLAVLPDTQPEVAALYHTRMLALHLLVKGSLGAVVIR